MTTYQPKGGLCANCKKVSEDCSHLDFKSMTVVRTYADGTRAVKCTGYQKRAA